MNKQEYLKALEVYLSEKQVIKKDIDLIISDYSDLYDEALDSGLSHTDVVSKLGNPNTIYEAIKDDVKHQMHKHNRIVAITPFVAIITFYLLGFLGNLWEYSWMAFFIIPITAIIVNVKRKDKFVALSPFVAVLIFMITGFTTGFWHPTWLIFLIIPVLAISINVKGREKIVALSPFALTTIYILVSMFVDGFHIYGWAIFALTPILAIVLKPLTPSRIILLITIVLAVVAHQVIGHMTQEWQFTWLVYLIPAIVALFFGDIQIGVDFKNYKKHPVLLLLALMILTAYILVSILIPYAWNWSWIILLGIPMLGIYGSIKFSSPVAYMPFISTIIFIVLGQFFGLYAYAWLVYLTIPMVAILTNHDLKTDKTDE